MRSLKSGKSERDETIGHKKCTVPTGEGKAVIQYIFWKFLPHRNGPFATNKSSQKLGMKKKSTMEICIMLSDEHNKFAYYHRTKV